MRLSGAVFKAIQRHCAIQSSGPRWATTTRTRPPPSWTSYPYFQMYAAERMEEKPERRRVGGTGKLYSFDFGKHPFHCLIDEAEPALPMARWPAGCAPTWPTRCATGPSAFWPFSPPYSKRIHHNSDTEIELIAMRENFCRILEGGSRSRPFAGNSHRLRTFRSARQAITLCPRTLSTPRKSSNGGGGRLPASLTKRRPVRRAHQGAVMPWRVHRDKNSGRHAEPSAMYLFA